MDAKTKMRANPSFGSLLGYRVIAQANSVKLIASSRRLQRGVGPTFFAYKITNVQLIALISDAIADNL